MDTYGMDLGAAYESMDQDQGFVEEINEPTISETGDTGELHDNEGQNETTNESTEFSLESFLHAPEEFNSHEEAIQWYAERFQVVKEDLLNPDSEVGSYYRSKYMDEALKSYDSEIQGFKEEFLAMKANPREYLMQYIPEALALHGIEPILTEQQINDRVQNDLSQLYGPDYHAKWNPAELIYPQSFSSQLLQTQNSLLHKYNTLNEQNAQIYKEWNKNIIDGKSNLDRFEGKEEQEIIETIKHENRDKFIKDYGFDEQSYEEFIQTAAKKTIELEDLHKVIYFDGYLKSAYEQGLNDAKKGLYNKINQEGNARKITTPRIKQSTEQYSDGSDPWVYNGFSDFKIPNY